MIEFRTMLRHGGLVLCDVACRHPPGRGHGVEAVSGHALVFIRRGCFVRSVNGVESLLDPTVAYCTNPGQEQRYDHPHDGGDDCTSVKLDAATAASLWGGTAQLPAGPLPSGSRVDVGHRLLLAAARRGSRRAVRAGDHAGGGCTRAA
ncbi:MAG: hypothetical protein ACR2NR_04750 [Solirubrobacteraceae bacterium]